MRASRVLVVAVCCAATLSVGYALAPEPVPTLELVTPVSSTDAGEETE